MNHADRTDEALRLALRSEAFGMLIALAFCALGGFYFFSHLADDGGVVDRIFVWTLRGGAVAFGLSAVLAHLGHRTALIVDVVACGALAAVLIVTCVAWLAESVNFGQVAILGLAGLLTAGAARRSWTTLQAWPVAAVNAGTRARAVEEPSPPAVEAQPPPEAPSEPPPEGGFLAQLGREDDQDEAT